MVPEEPTAPPTMFAMVETSNFDKVYSVANPRVDAQLFPSVLTPLSSPISNVFV